MAVEAAPDNTWLLGAANFSSPLDVGNHFGTRIRGVFTPQSTGSHVFLIRSDDVGVLYLGTTASVGSKAEIARNPHAAARFDKYHDVDIILDQFSRIYQRFYHFTRAV